jgi:hypothetical protein
MNDDRLRVSAEAVKARTNHLRTQLADILGRAERHFSFDLRQVDGTSFDGRSASYGLNARLYFVGPGGEVFKRARERGGEAILVPLVEGDLLQIRSWLSVSMLWGPGPQVSGRRQIIYRSAQVAVYQATFQDVEALQLVRAEWVGKRLAGEAGPTEFDSGAAGHPHWHVDAISEIRERLRRQREEQRELDRLREEFMRQEAADRQYVDFDDLVEAARPASNAAPEYDDLDATLSSLHLAQCAPWHREPWDGGVGGSSPHAHNPGAFEELANWIRSTVAYLRHEFEKAVG